MFVDVLNIDEWQSRTDRGMEVRDPSWDQVQKAILDLDGMVKTMVILSRAEESGRYLIIAGQWDGRFLVNGTLNDVDFFSLVDDSKSRTKRLLFVGGQDGDYEERKCVPLSWAIEAAASFFVRGELEVTLNWESDD